MGDHETIFLADDSRTAREIFRDRLEFYGHQVVAEAGSLDEIRAIVGDQAIQFRVAILDHRMPKGDEGITAAELLRARRP